MSSQPFTGRGGANAPRSGLALVVDHEAGRRAGLCGLDAHEAAIDREDELQERRDRFCDYGPSGWAA